MGGAVDGVDLGHHRVVVHLAVVEAGHQVADCVRVRVLRQRLLAQGESVIKYKSPLNVLTDTYDHSCY